VERLVNVLVVAAGSALGGALRFLVSLAFGTSGFPWATLVVNIVGCYFIMLIVTLASVLTMPDNLRLFLITGIMGGLTTYSAFDYETTRFFQNGQAVSGLVNVGATLAACFTAGLLGIATARGISS
jgi:CrcB protein